MKRPRLRVGFLSTSWGPGSGGAETVLGALGAELVARGHAVFALTLETTPTLPEGAEIDERIDGLSLRRIGWRYESQRELADLIRTPPLEEAAARWSAELGLDLVHLHRLDGWGLGVPERFAELGVPVLWTLHDYGPLCPRGQLFTRGGEVCRTAEPERCGECWRETWPHLHSPGDPDAVVAARLVRARGAFEACAALLVPSPGAREVVRRNGADPDRLTVHENGIDLRAVGEVEPGRDPEGIVVGFLGSVQPSKGVLELATILGEMGAPFSLEVHGPREPYHGDRSYVEALEELAARSPNVHLAGPFRRADLPRILSRLHLVVVPSLWPETYGLVAREARAAGLPVFASRVGGLDDEAFHLLPPGETASWRAALERFAGDRSWRESLVAAAFTPRAIGEMGDELEALYLELAR